MAVNERDVQALTYLAKRIRQDTIGAGKWDEAGIAAKLSELIGQNLAITVERVVRHAADTEARTPGAILRPFNPPPPVEQVPLEEKVPIAALCSVCLMAETACRMRWAHDHEFTRNVRAEEAPVDVTATVKAIKQDIACEEPKPPPPERPHKPSEHVDALREQLTADPPPVAPPLGEVEVEEAAHG